MDGISFRPSAWKNNSYPGHKDIFVFLKQVKVYFWSLWYLKPSQVLWRLVRTFKGLAWNIVLPVHGRPVRIEDLPRAEAREDFPDLDSCLRNEPIDLKASRFSFLNDSRLILRDSSAARAELSRAPLLWQYHFHYHDYLVPLLKSRDRQEAETALEFIAWWREAFPLDKKGSRKAAWHPYVISKRIEAWIRAYVLLRKAGISPVDQRMRTMLGDLVLHGRELHANLERGTLANHLFQNIKALMLIGLFLHGKESRRWLATAEPLLSREIREQILEDGCHFEMSPMYHVALLHDVLDILETVASLRVTIDKNVRRTAEKMTAFLERILHPDGEIPFLNDSTKPFFIDTRCVLARGRAMLNEPSMSVAAGNEGASGYMVHRSSDLFLVFDAGQGAPDYQPGHLHADALSFEMSWKGKRWISDTGVYHYMECPERRYSRSTAAHSTVEIDGENQSEVWKSFRVGRRARIVSRSFRKVGAADVFQAVHDGYTRLEKGLLHERCVVILPGRFVVVADWIHGKEEHEITSRFHFHPGIELERDGDGFIAQSEGLRQRILYSEMTSRPIVEVTSYFPEFGKKIDRKTLRYSERVSLPVRRFTLFLFDGDAPGIDLDQDGKFLHISATNDQLDIALDSIITP
ncbi:MAG: hypothetical protein GXO82_10635 [Chlorobi bacterium]|nr:hypothetical protein [Chlorobiota bacterium]